MLRNICVCSAIALWCFAAADVASAQNSLSRHAEAAAAAASIDVNSNGELAGADASGGGVAGDPMLTHSASQDIAAGNAVACIDAGPPQTSAENSFYRSFSLDAFGVVGDYVVTYVEIGIETNTGSVPHPMDVILYRDTNGGTPNLPDLVEVASVTLEVPPAFGGELLVVPIAATFAEGSTIVLEMHYPDAEDFGGDGAMWPGSNSAGQTAPSYIRSAACGLGNISTLASIGFPDVHLVFNVHNGGIMGACCFPDSAFCSQTDETECLDGGGMFQSGVSCGDVTCPNPACNESAGDCFSVDNFTPGCDGMCGGVPCDIPDCCDIVCQIDSFCCDFFWDSSTCVSLAQQFCVAPENNNCEDVEPQAIPMGGGTVSFTGNSAGATNTCDLMSDPQVWVAFTIEELSDVTLQMCNSPDFFDLNSIVLTQCPCETLIAAGYFSDDDCFNGQATRTWECLEAGTYYYNVLAIEGSVGAYDIDVTAVPTVDPDNCAGCPLGSLFGQPIGGFDTAATSDLSAGFEVADNFPVSGTFDLLRVWGVELLYQGGFQEGCDEIDDFVVTFYENSGNDTPGTLVDERTVSAVVVDTGIAGFLDQTIHQYDFTLDPPVTVADGWVSVQGLDDPANPDCYYLWVNQTDNVGDMRAWQSGTILAYDLSMCLAGEVAGGCPTGGIVSASPPDGTQDARQPYGVGDSPSNPLLRQGIGSAAEPIELTLGPADSGATAECFSLCETSTDQYLGPNSIVGFTETAPGVYEIVLRQAIAPGAWTTIGINGTTVSYLGHPADTDGGGVSNATDVLHVVNMLNGVSDPMFGIYSQDIDHSCADPAMPEGCGFGPSDILRTIDLLNGASTYDAWNGVAQPDNTCN